MLCDCVTRGDNIDFCIFLAKGLDVLSLLFRTDKTIWLVQNVHFDVVCTA